MHSLWINGDVKRDPRLEVMFRFGVNPPARISVIRAEPQSGRKNERAMLLPSVGAMIIAFATVPR
jgi:hypothetical protein